MFYTFLIHKFCHTEHLTENYRQIIKKKKKGAIKKETTWKPKVKLQIPFVNSKNSNIT